MIAQGRRRRARDFILCLALLMGLMNGVSPARAEEPPPGVIERTWFPLRPGDTGELVSRLQSRLAWLGYPIAAGERDPALLGPTTLAAVHAFDEKFAIAPSPDVTKEQWDAIARVAPKPDALPRACEVAARRGTLICVDMHERLVRLVRDGEVVLTTDARFGITGQETRPGSFRVTAKSRDHVSTLYGTAMPFALFFDGDRAVHYSAFFARDGYAGASHGCVNVRDRAKARALFAAARIGTPVIVTAELAR